MPTVARTYWTRPEQSNPVWGLLPPQTYGSPTTARACAAIRRPMEASATRGALLCGRRSRAAAGGAAWWSGRSSFGRRNRACAIQRTVAPNPATEALRAVVGLGAVCVIAAEACHAPSFLLVRRERLARVRVNCLRNPVRSAFKPSASDADGDACARASRGRGKRVAWLVPGPFSARGDAACTAPGAPCAVTANSARQTLAPNE